ncbi:hypothetical protein [Holdemania filiformis]|uniref:hypothetical protein n=1 Tax=Holdemania filiformis TaxID=61171 RepID=UPI0026747628|nr:hypothetical protein [Holdemania filiformis]
MDLVRYEIKKCLRHSPFRKVVIFIILFHCAATIFLLFQKENGVSWVSLACSSDEVSRQFYENQIEEAKAYPQFVEQVLSEDDRLRQSTLFNDPGSYAFLNSERKAEYYGKLSHRQFQLQPAFSLSFILQEPVSLAMVLIFIIFSAYSLLIKEKEDHLEPLLMPIPRYKTKAAVHKFISLFLMGSGMFIFLELLKWGISLLLLGWKCDLSLPIQTVMGFLYVPYAMSAGSFLAVYLSMKAFITLFFLLFISAIAVRLNQGPAFYLCVILLFGAEIGLYAKIVNESFLILLKYVNLATLLQFNQYLSAFMSVPIGNYPIEICYLIILTCLLGVVSSGIFFRYATKHPKPEIKRNWRLNLKHDFPPRSLLNYEFRKFWMNRENLFIFIALIILQSFYCWQYSPYIGKDEYYYQQFSFQLQGTLDERQTKWVANQNQYYAGIQSQISKLYEQYADKKMDQRTLEREVFTLTLNLESMEGFQRAEQQMKQLQSLGKTEYVYETPVIQIFKAKEEILLKAGFLFLAISFWIAAAVGRDNALQMNHLIRIYEQRKHKVDVQKRKIVYFVSGGVYSFLFLSTVIVKLNYYEANILSYSAANVLALGVSLPFSILGLLFILFVLGLGYVIIFDEVLFRLTSGQRNRNSALWTNIGLSVIFLMILGSLLSL